MEQPGLYRLEVALAVFYGCLLINELREELAVAIFEFDRFNATKVTENDER